MHHLAHAGTRVTDGAPHAGTLNDLSLVLRVRAILWALEVGQILPARLRTPKGLPVELDVEPLGREEAFLVSDEIVEAHSLWSDGDAVQAVGHGIISRQAPAG